MKKTIASVNIKGLHHSFGMATMEICGWAYDTLTLIISLQENGNLSVSTDKPLLNGERLSQMTEAEDMTLDNYLHYLKAYKQYMMTNKLEGIQYVFKSEDHSKCTYRFSSYASRQEWEKLHTISAN